MPITVALVNTNTHEIFYNKLGYKFLELPKFVETEEELETDLDRWFYLLKHMSHLDKVPAVLNKRVFQKVFKIAEVSNLTKEEKAMYDSSLKAKWDYENSIAYAEEKGRHEEALIIALEMKKDGFPVAQIAKLTKLSIEEIEKL